MCVVARVCAQCICPANRARLHLLLLCGLLACALNMGMCFYYISVHQRELLEGRRWSW
jgi:hypothetical protein